MFLREPCRQEKDVNHLRLDTTVKKGKGCLQSVHGPPLSCQAYLKALLPQLLKSFNEPRLCDEDVTDLLIHE